MHLRVQPSQLNDMQAKLIEPIRGWRRILWSAEYALETVAQEALDELLQIPGCYGAPQRVDVPQTAWGTDPFQTFCDQLELVNPHDSYMPPAASSWDGVRLGLELPRPLYKHQLAVVNAGLHGADGLLLADDMGLGKTAAAAVVAEQRRQELAPHRPGLIIGPLYVRNVWQREMEALGLCTPEEFCALSTTDLTSDVFRNDAKWYFVHYEVLRYWWSRFRGPRSPVVGIVDEAHWIRNGRTERAKATALAMSQTQFRMVLTGTPMEAKPSDLWQLLSVATGPRTWGGPLEFRKRYCGAVPNGFGHEDTQPTHIEELRTRMAPFYLRRTAAEAGLEMPPLTRQPVLVPMRTPFAREHADVLEGVDTAALVHALQAGTVSDEVLGLLTQLRTITSRAKLAATVEQALNVLAQGESVVIFVWARATARLLQKHLSAHPTHLVTGDILQVQRDREVERFQASDTPTALIATYGVLREGVTLHRARIEILHDLDWQLDPILQAEKRIHRIGQARACQSIWMLAEHSIDTLMAPILLAKAAVKKQVLGIDNGDLVLESLAAQAPDMESQIDRALRVGGF